MKDGCVEIVLGLDTKDGCVVVGVEVGWSVVEEWLLSEVGIPACAFLAAAEFFPNFTPCAER